MRVAADAPPPAAPWQLSGDAIVAARLVPECVARSFLPHDVSVVCVWPRRTIAVVYLARYRGSPVGEYRECIVAPALARVDGRIAFWISHIVVDSEASLRAGRSIWSLPKAFGAFSWEAAGSQARIQLTSSELKMNSGLTARGGWLRLPFAGPAMSRHDSVTKRFSARGTAALAVSRGTIELNGAGSPFADLGFQHTRTLFVLENLRLTIGVPNELGSQARGRPVDARDVEEDRGC